LLLNLENFTSHCLKNPEILLVLLIGPLLIRTYCVYPVAASEAEHFQKVKKPRSKMYRNKLVFYVHIYVHRGCHVDLCGHPQRSEQNA
jgi:hypothetical protein